MLVEDWVGRVVELWDVPKGFEEACKHLRGSDYVAISADIPYAYHLVTEALNAFQNPPKKARRRPRVKKVTINGEPPVQQAEDKAHEGNRDINVSDQALEPRHPEGFREDEQEQLQSEEDGRRALQGEPGDDEEEDEYVAAKLPQSRTAVQGLEKDSNNLASTVGGVLGVSLPSSVGANIIADSGQPHLPPPPIAPIAIPLVLNEEEDHDSDNKEEPVGTLEHPVPSLNYSDRPSHLSEREEQRNALRRLASDRSLEIEELDIFRESPNRAPYEKKPSLDTLIPPRHDSFLTAEPMKSCAGVPIKSSRLSLLRTAQESPLKSRTPHDLFISVGLSERELLMRTIKEDQPSMCQITVSNYARLFPHLVSASLRDSFTALPIASLYRDSQISDNLPLFEDRYLNSDGTGFLVKHLVENPGIISTLETKSQVFMFTDAAIFEAPEKRGSTEYIIPEAKPSSKASFVVTQRLDMSGLSPLNWRMHKDQIGLYIALYYEAVYIAAITQKAKAVILTPALSNVRPEQYSEQYSYMLDILLRVHRTLSSRLDATQITIAMPPELEDFDYESAVRQQNLELAKEEVKIYLEVEAENGSRTRQCLVPLERPGSSGEEHDGDEEEAELTTVAPVLMEAQFRGDAKLDVFLDEGVASFLLSNYLKCPKEDRRRTMLAPATFSVGNGHILNTNVIINSISID